MGDVAFEYSKRVDKPSESGFDRFVGSANIGQFDFRIKSWESTSDVESNMKQFEVDDYLLVRRSLYASDFRERAPLADFAGICSGDILTIRENPDKISKGFLIGVLNSPVLWKYIVANASGSITRRIKWKELANYEFLLPPKDQQAKLADLLWAGDEAVEKYVDLKKALFASQQLQIEKYSSNEYKKTQLGKVLSLKKVVSLPPHNREKYIGLENIESGAFSSNSFSESSKAIANCFCFEKGDLLYSKLRPYLDKAFIADFSGVCSTELIVYNVVNANIDYVLQILHSKSFINYVNSRSFGTKMPRVSHDIVASYQSYLPSIEKQIIIAEKSKTIQASIQAVTRHIIEARQIQKQLINQIFSA